MKTKPTLLNLAIATLITGTTLSLSGCGGGGDSAAGYTPDVPDQYVSGTVTRGPVAGAAVTIFAVNADGTNGAPIGSAITNNNGEFSLKLMTPINNQMIFARVSNGT